MKPSSPRGGAVQLGEWLTTMTEILDDSKICSLLKTHNSRLNGLCLARRHCCQSDIGLTVDTSYLHPKRWHTNNYHVYGRFGRLASMDRVETKKCMINFLSLCDFHLLNLGDNMFINLIPHEEGRVFSTLPPGTTMSIFQTETRNNNLLSNHSLNEELCDLQNKLQESVNQAVKSNNNVNTVKCNNDATQFGVTCSNTDETMQPFIEDHVICNNNNDMVLSMDVTCNNTLDEKHHNIDDNLLCNINNDINLSIDAITHIEQNELITRICATTLKVSPMIPPSQR